jgi:hypothetical protein
LSTGVVVDSCVMQRYTLSLVEELADVAQSVVSCIEAHHKFAMDEGGMMQHQWLETCGQVFAEKLFGWLREG